MKYKVFFDTNIIRNTGFNTFFGSQEKLKELSFKADIMIPEIVFEEIIAQKREEYKKAVKELKKNKVYNQMQEEINLFDIDKKITSLISDVDFKCEIVKLKKPDVINDMIELALRKCAPFEENCDKGFKDSCLYFSVLDYLKQDSISRIFLCCQDGRLSKAFKGIKRIERVDFDEISGMFVDKYKDQYFITRLNSEVDFGFTVSENDIIDLFENYLENDVIVIRQGESEESNILIEISEKEIISKCLSKDKNIAIKNFSESRSFYSTHRYLSELLEYTQFIDGQDIAGILQVMINNQQIRYLLNDEDLKQFISDMLEFIILHVREEELLNKFNDYSSIKI